MIEGKGYSIPPPPPPPIEDEEEVAQEQTRGSGTSTELKVAAWMGALLLGVTGIVSWANYNMLRRGHEIESPFRIEISSALESGGAVFARLEWRRFPVGATSLRPEVLLDGTMLPASHDSPPLEVSVPPVTNREAAVLRVGLRAPPGLPPGGYEGTLSFTSRARDSSAAGEDFLFSLRIPSWRQEWSLLLSWLKTAGVLVALLWVTALYNWPARRGALQLAFLEAGQPVREDEVRFRWSLLGWLVPWRRSVIDVPAVVSKRRWGRGVAINMPSVRIEFVRWELLRVLAFIEAGAGGRGLRWLDHAQSPGSSLSKEDGTLFGGYGAAPLWEEDHRRWIIAWLESGESAARWVAFRHVLDRRGARK